MRNDVGGSSKEPGEKEAFLTLCKTQNWQGQRISRMLDMWDVKKSLLGLPEVKTPSFQCRGHRSDPW